MVVSKRCKICAVIDTENVPIAGEYFGKQIPDIILKISGVELDPRKANDVLICQSCVIQLVHVNVVIEKVRNAVQRLKKNVKSASLKTPKKTGDLNKSASETVERQPVKIDRSKQNGETPISGGKHIKKSPATKRKCVSTNIEIDGNSSLVKAFDNTVGNPKKSLLKSEESPMDLTVDEQDYNVTTNSACIEQVNEKARNCILCDKIFHSKRTLREHIETAHMGERLKACPHCSCEFRSLQKYESHVFSEKCKSNNHPCQHPNCNKRFKTVHKMELHMEQKHSSQCD